MNWIYYQKLPEKTSSYDDFISKFCQTFKEEIISILHKLFQNTKDKGTVANLFYETSTTLMPRTLYEYKSN